MTRPFAMSEETHEMNPLQQTGRRKRRGGRKPGVGQNENQTPPGAAPPSDYNWPDDDALRTAYAAVADEDRALAACGLAAYHRGLIAIDHDDQHPTTT